MKKISNDVALQTVLYTVSPQAAVRIIDEKIIYEGNKLGLIGYKYEKQMRSKITGIEADGDTLVLRISTKSDTY